MNKKIRQGLNNCSKKIGYFFINVSSCVVSIVRMIVLSRINIAFKTKGYSKLRQNNTCVVLANGPSLKNALENGIEILKQSDVFCVNFFFKSPFFWEIKPRFYFIIDGDLFNPTNELVKAQVIEMKSAFKRIDWDMFLVISSSAINGGVLSDLVNSKIHLLRMNTTTVEGFMSFRNLMYDFYMGMPKCQTVTNFALMAAVIMGYKTIYLYGADHSWTKDLKVDDDNIVYYGDRHVYNTDLSAIKLDYTIGTLLHNYGNMFDTHWIINVYSQHKNTIIINNTKGSFIDAYKRKI